MDIDMDIDIGLTEDLAFHDVDTTSDAGTAHPVEATEIFDTPNGTTNSNAHHLVPEKVHLRGLDNLTSKDIETFASEYFESHKPVHIEWIDDTSANLLYTSAEIAIQALRSFSVAEIQTTSQPPFIQTYQAKTFPAHPSMSIQVRIAVVGDRKQAGARERSRFYLFNPEYDPVERRNRAPRRYRDRVDGGYRSRRYDDHEQQKRARDTEFDASLYDDDEASVAQRRAKNHHESSPGTDSRDNGLRGSNVRAETIKELFPDDMTRDIRMLRDRSASPSRDDNLNPRTARLQDEQYRRESNAATANRFRARRLRASLKESGKKELFPERVSDYTHKLGALDAADKTADLFASGMTVPFMDGSGDTRANVRGNISSGIKIRGVAGVTSTLPQSFSIRGSASGVRAKELFPSTLENARKELFSERLEGRRGQRRQKAEDLFH